MQEPQSYADLDVSRGADFIVATDGNFSQRHRKDAGDCPEFYSPEYFLTKEYVDNIGKCIAAAQGRPPKARKPAKVPDEAVDECEDGHDSGSGSTRAFSRLHYGTITIETAICPMADRGTQMGPMAVHVMGPCMGWMPWWCLGLNVGPNDQPK